MSSSLYKRLPRSAWVITLPGDPRPRLLECEKTSGASPGREAHTWRLWPGADYCWVRWTLDGMPLFDVDLVEAVGGGGPAGRGWVLLETESAGAWYVRWNGSHTYGTRVDPLEVRRNYIANNCVINGRNLTGTRREGEERPDGEGWFAAFEAYSAFRDLPLPGWERWTLDGAIIPCVEMYHGSFPPGDGWLKLDVYVPIVWVRWADDEMDLPFPGEPPQEPPDGQT